MKKFLKVILIITLICALLCSCGKSSNVPSDDSTTDSSQSQTLNEMTTESDLTDEAENTTDGNTTAPSASFLPAGSGTAALENGQTYTGRAPMPLQQLMIDDPENTRGLSTEKYGYSYGVAKNGRPHTTSVNNQKYFDDNNYNALCLDTKTQEKVLYLTFDCGYENGYTSKILDVLKEKNVPSAFFCTLPQIKDYPDLIARMINEGHIVGNHSVTHPSFPSLTRTEMANEIKEADDYLRTNFGYSEPYFRFPMGEYSDCALDLVGSIGYRCVFWSVAYADWDLNNQKGAQHAFDTVTARLHPGAVILLHSVSPDNANALADIIDWAREQGYTFRSLRDYN